MKSIAQSVVAAALVAASSVGLADDISRWDPRMAADNAVVEGWKNLHYLKSDDMGTPDTEGTVDGTHPNDIGMRRMADVFGLAVKKALNLK